MTDAQVPDELQADALEVRCPVPDYAPECCDGWSTTVEIGEESVTAATDSDQIHVPDGVPTECPECGDRVLEYNGVTLDFHA